MSNSDVGNEATDEEEQKDVVVVDDDYVKSDNGAMPKWDHSNPRERGPKKNGEKNRVTVKRSPPKTFFSCCSIRACLIMCKE